MVLTNLNACAGMCTHNLLILQKIMIHIHTSAQYTANTNDYFGNQLRGMDVKLRIRLKWTINFDKTQWASIDQGGAPTTINAFFNPRLNQFCKSLYNYS